MLTPTEASRAPYEGDASIPLYVELVRPREERRAFPCPLTHGSASGRGSASASYAPPTAISWVLTGGTTGPR